MLLRRTIAVGMLLALVAVPAASSGASWKNHARFELGITAIDLWWTSSDGKLASAGGPACVVRDARLGPVDCWGVTLVPLDGGPEGSSRMVFNATYGIPPFPTTWSRVMLFVDFAVFASYQPPVERSRWVGTAEIVPETQSHIGRTWIERWTGVADATGPLI